MKCPKCKSVKTEIRTEGSRGVLSERIYFDVWRCRDCGHLWEKNVKE